MMCGVSAADDNGIWRQSTGIQLDISLLTTAQAFEARMSL